jgi:hypothetical protein
MVAWSKRARQGDNFRKLVLTCNGIWRKELDVLPLVSGS